MKEIALIGLVQSLFFSLLIISKRKKEMQDYFLFFFFIFVGAELLYRYLRLSINVESNSWIAIFDVVYWALFGPLTLFYINASIGKVRRIRLKHALHLIPLAIGLLAIKDFYLGDVQYDSFVAYFNSSTGVNRVLLFSWEFLSPAYIIYSLFILIKHQKHVKRYFSNVIGKNIRWLLVLVSGFILNMMLFYSVWLLVDVFHYNIDVYTFQFIPVAFLTVYIFFLGLFGYRQSGIFFNSEGTLLRNSSGKKKYNKSGLSEGERTELISRLNEIMLLEKPYLENDLNISNLAGMIDTDFHKLSQVINESFSKNFYDYINTYRIEESKRLLRKPDSEKFKIISIAYDSGFSTKSSFYNAFRKNTGLTPGEYVKKFRSQSSKAILN